MILGFDVSHHQGVVNFPATKAAGRDFVVVKATEGVGFTDPNFATYRTQAHAAGLVVGIYAFARDNSPTAEASYFAGVVGALRPGEFLVLDQEVAHAGGNVPWCATWLAAVQARYGIAPLIYMNKGAATGVASGDWSQVARNNGLWLASYDQAPATQTSVAYWGPVAMKQYYDKGSVLGVVGQVDVNAFYGTRDQLLAYSKPAPAPAPTPVEIDMQLTDLIESRIPSDVDPATGKGKMVPLFALLENVQYNAWLAQQTAQKAADAAGKGVATTVDAAAFLAALKADPEAMALLGSAFAKAVNDDLAKRVQS